VNLLWLAGIFRVPFSCRFGGMLCEELYYSGACQVAITSTSSVISETAVASAFAFAVGYNYRVHVSCLA